MPAAPPAPAVLPVAPPASGAGGEGRALLSIHHPRWRWVTAAALIFLAVRGFQVRWELLTASPYPLGVDGYFYPIQLRSLLERGHLYYPASPLAFWLMAPLAALADPILGAKLGAALGGAAVVWPAYALGRRLGGGRVAGLLAAVLAVSSTGSLLLSAEFVKNAFGVTFGLAALAAVLAAIDQQREQPIDQPSWRRWALAALGLLAALLAHKMAMALVLALGAPALVQLGWRRWPGRRRQLGLAVAVAAGALALLGVLAPGRFLSPAHLELLAGLFSGAWRWDAPALAIGRFKLSLGGEAWQAGVASLVAAAVLALPWLMRRWRGWKGRREGVTSEGASSEGASSGAAAAPASRLPAWSIVVLGLLVAWPTLAVEDPQGLGFRLRLIAFVPLALAASIAVGGALPYLRKLHALAPLLGRAAVALALALWLGFAPTRLDRGVVYAHPAMIAAVQGLARAVPPGDTVVVSERHTAFMATWYTRVRTSVRPTAGTPARRWRLMTLSFIGTDKPMSRALDAARRRPELVAPRGLHPKHHDGLVLLPEATWQWVLTQLPPGPRRYYEAWPAL